MLLVEGVSDGGGAGGGDGSGLGLVLVLLPIFVAAAAGSVALATYFFNVRKSAREAVWDYLKLLTSKEIAAARRVAAEAAAWEPEAALHAVDEVEKWKGGVLFESSPVHRYREALSRYEEAAHQLMWLIALAPSATPKRGRVGRLIIGRSLMVETAQVYWHLYEVVDDVSELIWRWGGGLSWEKESYRLDNALDYLPDVVPDYGDGSIKKPFQRLRGAPSAMRKAEKARVQEEE